MHIFIFAVPLNGLILELDGMCACVCVCVWIARAATLARVPVHAVSFSGSRR